MTRRVLPAFLVACCLAAPASAHRRRPNRGCAARAPALLTVYFDAGSSTI